MVQINSKPNITTDSTIRTILLGFHTNRWQLCDKNNENQFGRIIKNSQLIIKSINTFNNHMLNFLTTQEADSDFQKNRLMLTKPNYQAPNQQAIKSILHTFAGEDEQTRAQIAYACVVKKIHNAHSRDNWLQLLKNIIILDRVISENRFCQELVQTKLLTVQNYVDPDAKCAAIGTKKLLKGYWELIQNVCRLKISRKHILFYKRSERKGYLQSLHTHEIFTQIQTLQKIFDNSISLIFLTSGISNKNQRKTQFQTQKSKKFYNQFVSSSLADYLNIHFYSKLLAFFSCQYLCIHKFIQIILRTSKTNERVEINDAKRFKKIVFKFKSNCNNMIELALKNKCKKGFENIDIRQFSTFSEEHIIVAIDDYIQQNINISQAQRRQICIAPLSTAQNQHLRLHSQKFVDRKPLIYDQFYSVSQKTPRKFVECIKQSQQYGKFQDYFNSYSDEFPHKAMMTIDLIEDIKKQQEKDYIQILDAAKGYAESLQKSAFSAKGPIQTSFLRQIKLNKSKVKFSDILIFDKDPQKQQKQDSTNYSFKNSSRQGSLFDILNIKWLPQKSQV